ncbi:MAG: sigma-54-dependent Fis family transcriptional regulator [Bacteroidetes bacterium]|nr:sigma-54-dependent Fis family transcriptional regulator [Bacteroidota bacterium]MCH8169826.1 sigma-54-dependent Fis family transcriptional regulator [Bacteroidota bacterium]MCH8940947.1 sigma-54-dependent Fis family transcriptional regulator [Bacteroidota bacterium]
MTVEEFKNKYGIIGKSKEIRDLADISLQIAQSDISVLIYGESGVGKEIFASALHGESKRADKPLVSLNCGAIPEGILESELFGHEKGAFTGAVGKRKGYFEIADGGTLFLDEIAEMPLTTQVKLLRVLETKEFMRLGSETVTKVDVRIIAATNKDLQEEVDTKRFRNDLYFRLKAVTLTVPPLRKRKIDIDDLVDHFVKISSNENNLPLPTITSDALDFLRNYTWPGNVRELKNTIETAVILNKERIIDKGVFESLLISVNKNIENRNLPVFLNKSSDEADRELLYRALFELKKDIMELKDIVLYKQREDYEREKSLMPQEVIPLDNMEYEAIKNALEFTQGNKRKASKLLNISERTLYRKVKEYQL